ncbi:MAG: ABC transporter substrate-binding protein [Saprospiraceae bacterium]
MISAANHQQLLNGNRNLALILVLCFCLQSCASKKPMAHSAPKADRPKQKNTNLPTKIDTVVWNKDEIKTKLPKASNKKDNDHPVPSGKFVKEDSFYRVIGLIPMKCDLNDTSASKITSSSLRFIQYYAGMTMALDELNREGGKKIMFDIYDNESLSEVTNTLSKYEIHPPHLIIGPLKVEALKYTADWAKSHETSIISPWVSSSSIADNNPYYIQAKAGLSLHYATINEHARSHYPIENIVLVSKSAEESKVRYFNDNLIYKDSIKEKIIKETDLSTGIDPIFTSLFMNTGPTIFIVPYSSVKDENFIYHFLRRVMSEKGNKEVVIYGMYKWLEMKSDIIDFLNDYNIRFSIGNYFDQDNSTIKSFKKRYLDKFREFPSQDALEGYDIVKYAIKSLRMNGPDFQLRDNMSVPGLLETNFDLKAIQKSKSDKNSKIDYYENSYLKIVEIKNNKYKIVD